MSAQADPSRDPEPAGRPDSLARVVLEGDAAGCPGVPNQQRDREQAIHDLRIGSHFAPLGLVGPFVLHLSAQGGRLGLEVRDTAERTLRVVVLALSPFRRVIKEYGFLVESYASAMEEGHTARVQTIDMGRRGLHDEGAALLIERLRGKIDLDFETARRLFTLVWLLLRRP